MHKYKQARDAFIKNSGNSGITQIVIINSTIPILIEWIPSLVKLCGIFFNKLFGVGVPILFCVHRTKSFEDSEPGNFINGRIPVGKKYKPLFFDVAVSIIEFWKYGNFVFHTFCSQFFVTLLSPGGIIPSQVTKMFCNCLTINDISKIGGAGGVEPHILKLIENKPLHPMFSKVCVDFDLLDKLS